MELETVVGVVSAGTGPVDPEVGGVIGLFVYKYAFYRPITGAQSSGQHQAKICPVELSC